MIINKIKTIFVTIFAMFAVFVKADSIVFVKAYPSIIKIQNNTVYFKNGIKLKYSDKKRKKFNEKLKNPSIKDMISQTYPIFQNIQPPIYNFDPGRYRNTKFFQILYGKNKKEVEKNLVKVIWLKNSENRILWFNKLQNAAKSLQKASNELDKLPLFYKKYVTNIAGTFRYRNIAGTNRLSAHSFGIAIDINIKFSNYWRWGKNRTYKNQIPKQIIDIFEKNGFIWGGRWYHYDTMHFEYRPEFTKKL